MTPPNDINLKEVGALRWPRHLWTPAELLESIRSRTRLRPIKSPVYSKFILQFIGSWSYLLAHALNKSHIFNLDTFNRELQVTEERCRLRGQAQEKNIDSKKPLLTYSNHISCIDDPILWASLLPLTYYSTNTDSVRWTAAAVEICFSKPWHSTLFSLGKTFPIVRGAGLDQPAMDFASALLNYDQWLHLFPEGRVMRDNNQQVISNKERGYIFKWGIAKLILDYFYKSPSRGGRLETSNRSIRILPFYHLGLDKILPVGRPYIPRFGKHITINIRPKVIEMNVRMLNDILQKQSLTASTYKSQSNDDILRIKLTNFLEDELEKLIKPTEMLHARQNL